jgi:hypothetical protein
MNLTNRKNSAAKAAYQFYTAITAEPGEDQPPALLDVI